MKVVLSSMFGTALFVYVAIATRSTLATIAAFAIVVLLGGAADAGPTVTLGMVLAGQLSPRLLMPIFGGQLIGAVLAAELLKRFTL